MHAVIDTNILIYDSVEDSVHHDEARELLDTLDRWLVPTITLYEYVWFFKRQEIEAGKARELLDNYIGDPRTDVLTDDGTYTEKAIETLTRTEKSLQRFNDAVILATSVKRGSIATFDKELRREAEENGIKALPETR